MKITIILIPAAIALMVLTACQMMGGAQGRLADPAKIVVMEPAGKGLYDGDDLILFYKYAREGSRMNIEGELEFTGGVANFDVLDYFSLDIYPIDAEGRIMGARGLLSAAMGRPLGEKWEFRRVIDFPTTAAGIAFGYSGLARTHGFDDEHDSWSFWDTPY